MARNPTWTRDELILALDLYLRGGQRGPEDPEVRDLSRLLNSLPLAVNPGNADFRNPAGVGMKLGNFAAIDPNHVGVGLPRGGHGDREVWEEFSGDPSRLSAVASAIRSAVAVEGPTLAEPQEDEEASSEGRLLFRRHLQRERNKSVIARKKRAVLAATGTLACEVCSFDFGAAYGPHGAGYAECHHLIPLSVAGPSRTYLSDLAVVCANCHRMLHRGSPWPTVEQLRRLLR